MKRSHSLLLVCVLSTAAGCGAPQSFLDGAVPFDDETAVDAAIPADPDAAVEDTATDEDALKLEADAVPEDAVVPLDSAQDAGRETSAPADVVSESPVVYPDTGLMRVDAGVDARPDASRDVVTDARDGGADTRSDALSGCREAADCNDGLPDTRDWCEFGGTCRHERCDDGNPCTANVATSMGCSFPVLPDGTTCRPGPIIFTCTGGVCPSCGGENEVCCEWPGSTAVCSGTARCRTTAAGFRRCITCGGPGERCCLTTDGIMWASERCNAGLTCSAPPGVAGTCR